jgi:hypothetical protein
MECSGVLEEEIRSRITDLRRAIEQLKPEQRRTVEHLLTRADEMELQLDLLRMTL